MSRGKRIVERGKTYEHAAYGPVEVTGIWEGTHRIDSTRHTNEAEVIIVRYSAADGGERVPELTDTLSDFLDTIES